AMTTAELRFVGAVTQFGVRDVCDGTVPRVRGVPDHWFRPENDNGAAVQWTAAPRSCFRRRASGLGQGQLGQGDGGVHVGTVTGDDHLGHAAVHGRVDGCGRDGLVLTAEGQTVRGAFDGDLLRIG